MKKNLPPPDLLRQMIKYDPETGFLVWLERRAEMFNICPQGVDRAVKVFNSRYAGKRAFTSMCPRGYYKGKLFSQSEYAHRVAWCLYYGDWPVAEIDHINRCKSDNRICNLRSATASQNRCNRGAQSNSKTGVKGVFPSQTAGKWIAKIRIDGVQRHLGTFGSIYDAKREYQKAAISLHGGFLSD